jgi:RNA polymerase sigma-70 factor (ECF subfamily)
VPIGDIMAQEEWLTNMEEALGQLPEPFRVILALKYMHHASCQEIAQILDLSMPAVKSRLFEARKLLRKKTELLAEREKGVAQ